MSDQNVAEKVIAKVGLWWPTADEDGLRRGADAWRTFADTVDGAAFDGSSSARSLIGANSGPAVDAFETFWAQYDGSSTAYLPGVSAGARAMATSMDDFASAVSEAKRRVEELAVEIGATLLIGTALAICTFGAAEAAAAGISGGLISAAAAIGVELGETAAALAGGVLAGAAFGAVESAAVDIAVAQPIRVEAFHDGEFSLAEVEGALATGGVLGGLGGGAGAALKNLRGVGAIATDDLEAVRAIRAPRGTAEWADEVERVTAGRLSRADALAIYDYTTDAGPRMNAYLRNRNSVPDDVAADFDDRIQAISKAMAKLSRHSGTTFRGTDLPSDVLARWTVGSTVRDPAFTSSSESAGVADGFADKGNAFIEIRGGGGVNVEPMSKFPGEVEALFPPDAEFDVLSRTWDSARGRWKFVIEEVRP